MSKDTILVLVGFDGHSRESLMQAVHQAIEAHRSGLVTEGPRVLILEDPMDFLPADRLPISADRHPNIDAMLERFARQVTVPVGLPSSEPFTHRAFAIDPQELFSVVPVDPFYSHRPCEVAYPQLLAEVMAEVGAEPKGEPNRRQRRGGRGGQGQFRSDGVRR